MTVYDCCMFANENDLFEIRLNQHWDFVDKFIVVEAGETHTGLKKPLNFDHARFAPWASKIEYRSFDNFKDTMAAHPELLDACALQDRGPNYDSLSWTHDHFQYNYMFKVLQDLGAQDEDIVYISCCDELIRKEAFESCVHTIQTSNGTHPIFMFNLDCYAYKFNLLHKKADEHVSANLSEFINFKKTLPATIRDQYICNYQIPNAGWHFTFLDKTDGEAVLEKQRSWAHSKDVYPGKKLKFDHTTKEEAVQRLFDDYMLKGVFITEESHPKYLLDNLDKFKDFIYDFDNN